MLQLLKSFFWLENSKIWPLSWIHTRDKLATVIGVAVFMCDVKCTPVDLCAQGAVTRQEKCEQVTHLVVLGNDHAGPSGEVEGDRGLVAAQVVDVEDNGLWQVLLAAPDDPAKTRIHQPIPAEGTGKLSFAIHACSDHDSFEHTQSAAFMDSIMVNQGKRWCA